MAEMADSVPSPKRRVVVYAILGGIVAATIPFYCAAAVLILLHPTPTAVVTPSATPGAIPSRQFPLPATATPPQPSQGTAAPTHTLFIPPTPTVTPTASSTPTFTNTPPPTHTPTKMFALETSGG